MPTPSATSSVRLPSWCLLYITILTSSGPQTFIAKQAPGYVGGITAMLVSYCVCIVLALILGFSYYRDNKVRKAQVDGAEAEHSVFLDMTDKENKTFIYTS